MNKISDQTGNTRLAIFGLLSSLVGVAILVYIFNHALKTVYAGTGDLIDGFSDFSGYMLFMPAVVGLFTGVSALNYGLLTPMRQITMAYVFAMILFILSPAVFLIYLFFSHQL